MAEGHEALAGEDQSGDGLIEVGQGGGIDRNFEGGGGAAEGDGVMQAGIEESLVEHGVDEGGETAADFEAGIAGFAGGFAGAEFVVQAREIDGLEAAAEEGGFEGAGFFEVGEEEGLDGVGGEDLVVGEGFKAEGVGGGADGEGGVGEVEEAEEGGIREREHVRFESNWGREGSAMGRGRRGWGLGVREDSVV